MSLGSVQPSEWNLSIDPSRPVLAALGRAFVDNFNALMATIQEATELAEHKPARMEESEIVRRAHKALGFAENVSELADWVYSSRLPLPFEEAFEKAQLLKKLGADADWVKMSLSDLQKRRIGRPHQRQVYVRAFEFQLQSKKNSQGPATRKFCPCGEKAHTAKCEQNLKAGMRSLKKVLRKYAPELVLKYESLHPDRAKKVNGQ
jgi:hypothetical protein